MLPNMATLPDYARAFPRTLPKLWTFGDAPVYPLGHLLVVPMQIPPDGLHVQGEDAGAVDWATIPASMYTVFDPAHQGNGDIEALYDGGGNFIKYYKLVAGTSFADVLQAISVVGGFAFGANNLFSALTPGAPVGDVAMSAASFDFGGSGLDVSFTAPSFSAAPSATVPQGDWGPQIDYGMPGDVVDMGAVSPVEQAGFADAQASLDAWNAQMDPQWAAQTGAVTGNQFASMVGLDNQVVKTAAKQLLQQVGASTKPTAPQIAAAQQLAQRNASAPGADPMWSTVNSLLSSFAVYQARAGQPMTPGSTQYPAAPGQFVTQPGGAISVRNPDGSITTVQPNGVRTVTQPGASLGGGSLSNVVLIAGAGFAALLALRH